MKLSEYHSSAKAFLKGRYGEAFVVTAVYLFVTLTFRMAVMLAVYTFNDGIYPLVAEAVLTVLCFIITVPLLTGGVWWFYQTVSGGDNRNLLKLYSGGRLNRRAALLYIFMWVKGVVSLFPTALCWAAAYILIYGKFGLGAEIAVFSAFQLVMLGVVLTALFASGLLSTVLAPFIFISRPDMNPFRVMRWSGRLMKGHKLEFIRLILKYLVFMLPLVTIPFVLPSSVMAVSVFANERLLEGNF